MAEKSDFKAWEAELNHARGHDAPDQRPAEKKGFSAAAKLTAALAAASIGGGAVGAGLTAEANHGPSAEHVAEQTAENISAELMNRLSTPGAQVTIHDGQITLYDDGVDAPQHTLRAAPFENATKLSPTTINLTPKHAITLVRPVVVQGPDGLSYYMALIKPTQSYQEPQPFYVQAEIGGNGDAGQIEAPTGQIAPEKTVTIAKNTESLGTVDSALPMIDTDKGPESIAYIEENPQG